jgi:hypothetical protein
MTATTTTTQVVVCKRTLRNIIFGTTETMHSIVTCASPCKCQCLQNRSFLDYNSESHSYSLIKISQIAAPYEESPQTHTGS